MGTLGMEDPIVVTVSPNKPNIIFTTARYKSLEEIADPIMNLLKKGKNLYGMSDPLLQTTGAMCQFLFTYESMFGSWFYRATWCSRSNTV